MTIANSNVPAKVLHVYLSGTSDRSINPADSDFTTNLMHMEQIVGTLVKYDSVSSYEPFLAKSWSTSDDQLVWKFELRDGLFCEDGTPITASAYVDGLLLAFRHHASAKNLPTFSVLEGWLDFVEGRHPSVKGIVHDNSSVEFRFERKPAWVIDYLAMPYFGFHCPGNFDENGKWRDSSRIVSSGGYRLSDWNRTLDYIEISPRFNFDKGENFPQLKTAPTVRLHRFEKFNESNFELPAVVYGRFEEEFLVPNGWYELMGTQSYGDHLVLNPNRGVFKDKEKRKKFAKVFKKYVSEKFSHISRRGLISFEFFPSERAALSSEEFGLDLQEFGELKAMLRAVSGVGDNIYSQWLEFLVARDDVAVNLISGGGLDRRELHLRKSEEMDLYFSAVSKGAAADLGVIDMMFCSDLGVRFPDAAGRVCKLNREFEKLNGKMSLSEYSNRFEAIVEDEASVIPFYHYGNSWLYTSSVDFGRMSGTMSVPRFDYIKMND